MQNTNTHKGTLHNVQIMYYCEW